MEGLLEAIDLQELDKIDVDAVLEEKEKAEASGASNGGKKMSVLRRVRARPPRHRRGRRLIAIYTYSTSCKSRRERTRR